METITFLPGYLSPPSGFRLFDESAGEYKSQHLSPHPSLEGQLADWAGEIEPGGHLVASFEAGIAAVKLALEVDAKSLLWFSPFARVDAALKARLLSLQWALEQGGRQGFARVAAPLAFGGLMLDRGRDLIGAWEQRLDEEGLAQWLESLLTMGDERKWLRTLQGVPVMTIVGSEDVCTPMRYAHEITEWVPDLKGILVTLEGAGHFSFWENPREATSLLKGFVSRYQEFLNGPQEWQPDEDEPPPLRFEPESPA